MRCAGAKASNAIVVVDLGVAVMGKTASLCRARELGFSFHRRAWELAFSFHRRAWDERFSLDRRVWELAWSLDQRARELAFSLDQLVREDLVVSPELCKSRGR
jgi:hypothetical protein